MTEELRIVLRRWLPLLAVAALLAAVLAAATLAEPQIDVKPLPAATESAPQRAGPSEPPTGSALPEPEKRPAKLLLDIPPWLSRLIAIIVVSLVLLIIGVTLYFLLSERMRGERGRPVTAERGTPRAPTVTPAAEVAAAVDAGLAELSDADRDPRRAVIACWLRLEEAAAAAGTPRAVSDAPADHVLRLLSTQAVSRAVLDHFAAVYRHARYSTGPVDEAMRQSAITALRQLRTELIGEVVR